MWMITPKSREARARLMNRTGRRGYLVSEYCQMVVSGQEAAVVRLGALVDDAARAHVVAQLAAVHQRTVQAQYDHMTAEGVLVPFPLRDYRVVEVAGV